MFSIHCKWYGELIIFGLRDRYFLTQQLQSPAASSSVPLKDVSVEDVSVILNNASFSALVEPFRRNGMSGKAINRIKSCEDIMELDKAGIRRVVAETFFEDFVQEWKSTGVIPKQLPQESSPASSDSKVFTYVVCVRMYVWMYVYGRCCCLFILYIDILAVVSYVFPV